MKKIQVCKKDNKNQFKFVMCEAKSENCTGLLGKGY